MAMSNCKECGKQVSTTAKTCPNCGASEPTEKKEKIIFRLQVVHEP